MRLKFVAIGQNLKWPRGRLSLARKKHRRKFMTLALARVMTEYPVTNFLIFLVPSTSVNATSTPTTTVASKCFLSEDSSPSLKCSYLTLIFCTVASKHS